MACQLSHTQAPLAFQVWHSGYTYFPGGGLSGLRAQCVAETFHSLERISLIVVTLLLWMCGPDCTVSLSLLFISLWLFSCWKSFLLGLEVFIIDSCSVNNCDFFVPTGRVTLGSFYFVMLATPTSAHCFTHIFFFWVVLVFIYISYINLLSVYGLQMFSFI